MYEKKAMDIIVGTNSRFETKRKASYRKMMERGVERFGILLYDQEVHI